jgi:broad specificity phosphatase PhoE
MSHPKKVYLVRHGETMGANAASVGDPTLTHLGERQASLTAGHLRNLAVTSVSVSPLLRAQQTAAPMTRLLGKAPTTLESITEIELGNYPGDKATGRERPLIEFAAWGGDSGTEFNQRAISGFQRVLDDIRGDDHRDIALVSHGGTINVILDHVAGLAFDGEMRHLLANCSVSTLEVRSDSVSLVDVNFVDHLPEELITPPGENLLPGGPSR